jgi:hypothetical protein
MKTGRVFKNTSIVGKLIVHLKRSAKFKQLCDTYKSSKALANQQKQDKAKAGDSKEAPEKVSVAELKSSQDEVQIEESKEAASIQHPCDILLISDS